MLLEGVFDCISMNNDGTNDYHDRPDPVSLSLAAYLCPGRWLPLERCPNALSPCEALLICQVSEREWVTWIPEYGEHSLQF